jgi:putative redox protein
MDFTSKIIYSGNLRTEATHLKSGKMVITDAPTDNNGKGEAFSPTDLLSTSLVSCMMTLMGIAANNHGFELGNMEATMKKHMASNPRRVGKIEIELEIYGTYTDKQKLILDKAARTCPVAMSLHPDIEQFLEVTFKPA